MTIELERLADAVPAALLPRTDALAKWFAVSHDYVARLQPRSRRS